MLKSPHSIRHSVESRHRQPVCYFFEHWFAHFKQVRQVSVADLERPVFITNRFV
ncbi:hypothetical protein RB578 [Rhodopirellula baltica SH 1]|uniref:Uncharacterized protein n=1 Tax=Rhodopirellula baltica (strain DSM 10527 / NCIMB 13988 / SH1) TaxID=243090 RepID=Q7UYI0_RHOBA|nr:hypothetical protein RB578 [Rhodopirellula baltica SH 1]